MLKTRTIVLESPPEIQVSLTLESEAAALPAPTIPTVSELAAALKRTVEGEFGRIFVRGEISGLKIHSSGHVYFALKDAEAVIQGVCWRGVYGSLGLNLEEGMEIIARGRLTTYPGRSQYQIVLEGAQLAGQGAQLKLLEERKKRLAAEGLFDAARKRSLPRFPWLIGVVTSPTGAVIRDILHRLRERFPTRVILWPVLVQGPGAADQITHAIQGFQTLFPRPDLLIVARGGGSLEDLWCFNEENVVRAAASSTIPLISAVGHETDVTLIDFAADRRAPTPTAAAELATPEREILMAQLIQSQEKVRSFLVRHTTLLSKGLEGLSARLLTPRRLLELKEQKLDDLEERAKIALSQKLKLTKSHLAALQPRPPQIIRLEERLVPISVRLKQALRWNLEKRLETVRTMGGLLDAFSHFSILERGFVWVSTLEGVPVQRKAQIQKGTRLRLHFQDGEVETMVMENSI